MSLSKTQADFARDVARLIQWANGEGYELTFGDAYRSEDQQYLYFKGWTIDPDTDLLVPVARRSRTMNSRHRRRLAVDLNLFRNGSYLSETADHEPLGEYWESLHPDNRWGGHFGDGNHYERAPNA